MYKKGVLLLFFVVSTLTFSYGITSASESSEWSVLSYYQQKYKFSDRKPEMTLIEALHRASENYELDGLHLLFDAQKMFSKFGAQSITQREVNDFFEGYTPLIRAVYKSEKRMQKKKTIEKNVILAISFLLSQGAQVSICDEKKRNVLMYAAQSGCRSKIFQLLLDVAPHKILNDQDYKGNTVVHYAIRSPELLCLLKKNGANMLLKNKKELSPLEVIATHLLKGGDQYKKAYQRSIQILSKR